jgi:hypothetical protein
MRTVQVGWLLLVLAGALAAPRAAPGESPSPVPEPASDPPEWREDAFLTRRPGSRRERRGDARASLARQAHRVRGHIRWLQDAIAREDRRMGVRRARVRYGPPTSPAGGRDERGPPSGGPSDGIVVEEVPGEPQPTDSRRRQRRRASQPRSHLLPALGGATGLIDLPVALTPPRGRTVIAIQHESFRGRAGYWPEIYGRIDETNRYASVIHGLGEDLEVSAHGEIWSKTLSYRDPFAGTEPSFSARNKAFLGLGAKHALALGGALHDRAWAALGFRYQFFDAADRDTTELSEYERFSHAYAVLSAKLAGRLWTHGAYKRVSYDLGGGRPPSGRTGTFPGRSARPWWNQWGLGLEWLFAPRTTLVLELVDETGDAFPGSADRTAFNAALRHVHAGFGAGVYARRLNQRGLEDNGLQVAWRF